MYFKTEIAIRFKDNFDFSVHGNDIGDQGMAMLGKSVASHPHIVSLDVGDCGLTDGSIPVLADLLPPNGAKRGMLY